MKKGREVREQQPRLATQGRKAGTALVERGPTGPKGVGARIAGRATPGAMWPVGRPVLV